MRVGLLLLVPLLLLLEGGGEVIVVVAGGVVVVVVVGLGFLGGGGVRALGGSTGKVPMLVSTL